MANIARPNMVSHLKTVKTALKSTLHSQYGRMDLCGSIFHGLFHARVGVVADGLSGTGFCYQNANKVTPLWVLYVILTGISAFLCLFVCSFCNPDLVFCTVFDIFRLFWTYFFWKII